MSSGIKTGFFLLVVLFSSTSGEIRWSSSGGAGFVYDNNIFYLSPLDLDRFRLGEEPARFPFNSADDVFLTMSGVLTGRLSDFSAFRLGCRVRQYISNQEKSYSVINIGIEQKVARLGAIAIFHRWLPNYLIRYYRQVSSKDYLPCRFGEQLFGFDFQHRFRTVSIKPGYRFEIDDYLKPFDYYDTKAHRLTGLFNWRPSTNLNIEAEYQFKIAQANGPVPDISYQEHRIGIDIATNPRIFNHFGIEAGYEFCHRVYTTGNPVTVDPYHYGRIDETQRIDVGGNYRVKPFTFTIKYQLEWREVNSPYQGEIEEIKEYQATRLSLGIKMPVKLREE